MRIRFERKRWGFALLLAAAVAAAQFYAGNDLGASLKVNLLMSAALGMAGAAAVLVRVEIRSWWSALLEIFCTAFAGLFLLQYALIKGMNLPADVFRNNMLVSLAVLLFLTALTGRPRPVCAAWLVFCCGFSLLDAAVMQFRGNFITVGDLFSIQTALNVAGKYRFKMTSRMITQLCVFAITFVMVCRSKVEVKRVRKLPVRVLMLVLAVASAWLPVSLLDSMNSYTWGREGAYFNGVLMELMVEAKNYNIEAPEGYSAESVQTIAGQHAAVEGEGTPHVIAIMVEAMSDISVLGEFETTAEVMPFCESLKEHALHGYALASVLGGGTSNSEWEFLTGNSMGLLPAGSNAYRQFVRSEPNSLVKVMKGQGYQCIAMHPYYESGWDRQRIYPMMGFEETYFLKDLDWGERVRGMVSDSAFVKQVIAQFEERRDDGPLFLFGVTMQNHSGYTHPDFEATVRATGLKRDYGDVNQYLSLMQLTDAAIEELIEYFRGVEEPVVVVIFGDHQPSLSSGFLGEIGLKDQRDQYKVPWFVWRSDDETGKELPLTSLNYLPTILLEAAGMDMPGYYSFLNDMRRTLPAISSISCATGEGYAEQDELQGEAAQRLAEYRILQYANLFDSDVDRTLFVGDEVQAMSEVD